MTRAISVGLAGIVLGGLLAGTAGTDIALLSVRPGTAQVGDQVEVRAGAYKRLAPMPLYLVARARAPKPHPCGPRKSDGTPTAFCEPISRTPPYTPGFHFVGRLDFRRHPRNVRLLVRVPRVTPGAYLFVIYCEPCNGGRGGTLITTGSPSLRVTP